VPPSQVAAQTTACAKEGCQSTTRSQHPLGA
jgi:hypothetical protein